MRTHIRPIIWFGVALLLTFFMDGRWRIPLAVWLAPIFWIRFMRSQSPLVGYVLIFLGTFVAGFFSMQGIIPMQLNSYLVTLLIGGAISNLTYLADRLLAPRIRGFASTLVFPTAFTGMEYLNTLTNPFGTWGSLAYTQFNNLPLIQLVSIAGIWGISFLIAWFASSVNWAWEQGFEWANIWRGIAIFGCFMGAVLVFGGARLTLAPPTANTVQVAGIVSERQDDLAEKLAPLLTQTGTSQDWDEFFAAASQSNEELFEQSDRAAKAGAKFVIWSEGAGVVNKEDESALIERGKEFARSEGIYLGMSLANFLHEEINRIPKEKMIENKVILIDPSGSVAGEYLKAVPVPGLEDAIVVKGTQPPMMVDTPYGRIAMVICFDADFPQHLRSIGSGRADIIFIPSSDWEAITPLHTQMAGFRALENGFSLVRITHNGLSAAMDYRGVILASMNAFKTEENTMMAHVPMKGTVTVYSYIGDTVAWLSIAGFVILGGWVLVKGRFF